jgi:hypothetical protein
MASPAPAHSIRSLDHISTDQSCFKTKKALAQARCRYDYGSTGRKLCSCTRYSVDRGLQLQRDFGHVVPHNKLQALKDRCNTCLEWILQGMDGWAIQE